LSVVAGTADGRLLLWQIGEPEATLLLGDQSLTHPCDCLPAGIHINCWVHCITTLVALDDSPTMVAVTQGAVQLWNRITHQYLKGISCCARTHYDSPFSTSPNKTMLAVECDRCIISVHSLHNLHHLHDLSGHQGPIRATAFSPQNHLCSASDDRTVRLWDVTTASQLKCIQMDFVLTDAVFCARLATFVLSSTENQGRMVRVVQDECIAFGPTHFRGREIKGPQLAADIIASYPVGPFRVEPSDNSVLVAKIEALVKTGAHNVSLEPSQPYQFGYLPSGEVVALYLLDSKLERPLEMSASAASLNVTVCQSMFEAASRDMSRVATIEDLSMFVYNTRSGKQEFHLPLPPLDAAFQGLGIDHVYFSFDSTTVYLHRKHDRLYVAHLPPASEGRQGEPASQLAFKEICDTPTLHEQYLKADGLPNSVEPHFVAEDSVCVWVEEQNSWTQIHPPSLPFDDIQQIAYSPSGLFVAIAIAAPGSVKIESIQIRSLPDYKLIDTLYDHRDSWITDFHFIGHLPHILVAGSPLGFTCWDAKARRSFGSCFSLSHIGSMERVHAYNGSDFLCLMKTPSMLLVLVAVQFQGADHPAAVQQICYFPPHLSIASQFKVNPLHPHIVALSTRNGIIEIDISGCALPFTL
jgi:WD40 repeat protein